MAKNKNKKAQDAFIEEVKQNTQDYINNNKPVETQQTPQAQTPVTPKKPAMKIPSWDQIKSGTEGMDIPDLLAKSYVIIDGDGNKVGTTTDANAPELLSGVARHPTYEDLAEAEVGDWYYGKDNKLHIVSQRDINYAKQMLAQKKVDQANEPGTEQTAEVQPENGLNKYDEELKDLDSKKADDKAPYEGPYTDRTFGYISTKNDSLDVEAADRMYNEAVSKDDVRQAAEKSLAQLKDYKKNIKKYDKLYTKALSKIDSALTKQERDIEKGLASAYENKLDQLSSHIEGLQQKFLDTYGISLEEAVYGKEPENLKVLEDQGIDINALRDIAGAEVDRIAEFNKDLTQAKKNFDYIMGDFSQDLDALLNGKLDEENTQRVLEKMGEVEPTLRDNLTAQLNLYDGTLNSLEGAVNTLNDPAITELYGNIKGLVTGFNEGKIDFKNPKTLEAINQYIGKYEDIIEHQDLYDQDTRYAKDLKLSAVNRMLFNIFDQVKSIIVFFAAIESGSPQMIRSAIDEYNYGLQKAEGQRKTEEYGAYTENKIREITQDNIARFKKITEIDPEIAKLEEVLNIQEGEAGKRQMDALETGFEAFNKYKQEHPGEAVDFAAWVSANRNAGGVVGQIISALLMNFPDLKNVIEGAVNKLSTGNANTTSSDEREKESIFNLSEGKQKKTSSILDGAVSKLSQSKEPEKKPDPALMMDMQNTVGQALASRQIAQGSAPQGQQLNTKTGFGRTV